MKILFSNIVSIFIYIKDNIEEVYFVYLKGLSVVHCIGDSHILVFKHRFLFQDLQHKYLVNNKNERNPSGYMLFVKKIT